MLEAVEDIIYCFPFQFLVGQQPIGKFDELEFQPGDTVVSLFYFTVNKLAAISSRWLVVPAVADSTTILGVASLMSVILYTTEESAASSAVTMPNLSGLTVSQAMARINAAELNVKVTGAGTDNPSNVVANQSIEEGETVDKGTVVTVEFRSTTDAID